MRDVEQFSNALYQLKRQEAFDVNINVPVHGKAYLDCVRLNGAVHKANKSPIVFDDNGLIFPHVTLKMGRVNCGCFNRIITKLGDFLRDYRVMELVPAPAILKSPANKYYFSEIVDERLIALSAELDKLLKDEMQLPRFPLSKDNAHHVTLGYKYSDDETVAPIIGETVAPFTADRVQVSVMGRFGVCIGVLKTFYLND